MPGDRQPRLSTGALKCFQLPGAGWLDKPLAEVYKLASRQDPEKIMGAFYFELL